jgi:hypothetical protein
MKRIATETEKAHRDARLRLGPAPEPYTFAAPGEVGSPDEQPDAHHRKDEQDK